MKSVTHFFGKGVSLIVGRYSHLAKTGKGEEPKTSSSIYSHTFIAVTDDAGKVIATYSWGNQDPDENGENKWAKPNQPMDMKSAQKAVDREKKREQKKEKQINSRDLGPKWAKKVGDKSKNEDAKKAYEELSQSASSTHKNGGAFGNNCKTEADKLEERMNELHEERTSGETNSSQTTTGTTGADNSSGEGVENANSDSQESSSDGQTQTPDEEEVQ